MLEQDPRTQKSGSETRSKYEQEQEQEQARSTPQQRKSQISEVVTASYTEIMQFNFYTKLSHNYVLIYSYTNQLHRGIANTCRVYQHTWIQHGEVTVDQVVLTIAMIASPHFTLSRALAVWQPFSGDLSIFSLEQTSQLLATVIFKSLGGKLYDI